MLHTKAEELHRSHIFGGKDCGKNMIVGFNLFPIFG